LGRNRRAHVATLAASFTCIAPDGIVSARGHGRLGLGRCPPSLGPHHRGVVSVVPDRVLARLRQLHDYPRQELQRVDPLDVPPGIIPAPVLTPTLLGMPTACPVEHLARLAVPLHSLQAHRRPGEAAREPLEAVAVVCLNDDRVVHGKPARVAPAEDHLHPLLVDQLRVEQPPQHLVPEQPRRRARVDLGNRHPRSILRPPAARCDRVDVRVRVDRAAERLRHHDHAGTHAGIARRLGHQRAHRLPRGAREIA
jgi:hypothetical protein